MITPPGLIGVALVFWGWRTGALWLALPMALLVEGTRLTRVRFEFTQGDLDRVWNLCVLLFVASAVIAFALGDGFDALGGMFANNSPARRLEVVNKSAITAIQFLQYTPATLLPIVLAQAVARQDRFPWSTFSSLLRQRRRRTNASDASKTAADAGADAQGINVSFPYLGLVLYASALSSERSPWFMPALAALLGWALWSRRPRAFARTACVVALLGAVLLGAGAEIGLVQLQRALRSLDGALMARLGAGKGYDPKGTRTRLGSTAARKNSGQIVLRVESDGAPPPLLREASYDLFRAPMWATSKRHFDRTLPDATDLTWPLVPKAVGTSTVTIATYLDGGKGLLPLPAGAVRLSELPVFLLKTNAHGVVEVEEGPGFVRFQARYQGGPSLDAPPGLEDRRVPPEEAAAIQQVADALHLATARPHAALEIVRRHFAGRFDYTTRLGKAHEATSNHTALARFLLETRSGHCEYFATATTLLLRAAGIPARYAVGYAVQERQGRFHIVRSRHAHAWTLAWIDGRWIDVDTTPGTWLATESSQAPFWEPVTDFFSRAWFEFSKWRWGSSDWKRHLVWLVIPMVVLVAVRLLRQKQWRRVRGPAARSAPQPAWPGLDSELFLLEQRLQQAGHERCPGETTAGWLRRIPVQPRGSDDLCRRLLDLHYRLRFDPAGLSPDERTELKTLVLRQLKAS